MSFHFAFWFNSVWIWIHTDTKINTKTLPWRLFCCFPMDHRQHFHPIHTCTYQSWVKFFYTYLRCDINYKSVSREVFSYYAEVIYCVFSNGHWRYLVLQKKTQLFNKNCCTVFCMVFQEVSFMQQQSWNLQWWGTLYSCSRNPSYIVFTARLCKTHVQFIFETKKINTKLQ